MKKSIFLSCFIGIVFFSEAQVQMDYAITKTQVKTAKIENPNKTEPIWAVTFDEDPAIWVFGQNAGTKTWNISDTTPTNGFTYEGDDIAPLWLYMGHKYVKDYSESGGNFAWIDGISDLLGLFPAEIYDSYIQFDGLDLTGVANPKLTFYQDYKHLNDPFPSVNFSIDGGTTWTQVVINEEVEGNAYGEDFFELIATPYIANQANVSIRFTQTSSTAEISGYGYGWQIDDIQIIENTDYDMKMIHSAMNFYEYYDYLEPENADYYHISSHYGNIPQMQYDSEFALSWFNVSLQNKGNLTIAPTVTVSVLDPDMTEIFTNTVVGNELAVTERDTVDLVETDFALGTSPALGKYTVIYNITIEGQEDANIDDNSDTTYFIINNNQLFSHDIESRSTFTGPGSWLDGGIDGEMIGTNFLYLFEDEITSMEVFINEHTSVGTAIIAYILQFNATTENWVAISYSSLITLYETNIGDWLNIEFTDAVHVIFEEGEHAKNILAGIEFYYHGEDNDIWIGYDYTIPVSSWGTKWKLLTGSNAGEWVSISNWSRGGLNLRLNHNGYSQPSQPVYSNTIKNMNIYPNPTTGILNIENVEGASIQVLNMMGQVVETVENANEFNQINMSNYSNGTYFVRVLIDNSIVTRKITLMK